MTFKDKKILKSVKIDFVTANQDAELISELETRISNINQYIQHPDRNTLLPLLGEDLQARYGADRVLRMADAILWGANDVIEDSSRRFTQFFDSFNERYFAGSLPRYDVVVRLSIGYYGRTLWHECRCIELLAGPESWMVVRLLEEMARIAVTDEYGQPCRDELGRLNIAGAPLDVFAEMETLSAEEFISTATSVAMNGEAWSWPPNPEVKG
jgi:hypothetical protein